jgi:predicted transcriptional regulator
MLRHEWFLALSEEIGQALNALYLPDLKAFIAEAGLEGTDLWIAQAALSAEPKPMAAAVILERAPYINESHIREQMAQSASRGVLTAVAPHTYTLTPRGRHFARTVPTVVYQAFQAMDAIIPPETRRLVELLSTLVSASLDAPEPITKAALQRSRFYDLGPQSHILERLRRALNDLAAFRDDVHLASWCAYEVTALAWEAFTHIHGRFTWGDPVTTAAALAQKLDFRGYDQTAYRLALEPLVTRRWLTEADGVYRLADKGEQVRQTAEDETGRLFYAPWPLDDTELAELKGLMEKVSLGLQPPSPETIWQTAYALRSQISQHYMPALQAAIEEAALPQLGLFLMMQAQVIAPEPLTAAQIQPIIPYMAATTINTRLATLAEAGLITAEHPDHYHLTPKGQHTVKHLTTIVKTEVAHITTPVPDKIRRTADLLNRLVQATAAALEPPVKAAFTHAQFHAATPQDGPLFQLLRAIAALAAFRDDAHVAAWSGTAAEGHQWEAFSHVYGANIWGNPISTTAGAAEKFAFRGYDVAAYQSALLDCVGRGWLLVGEDGRFTTTKAGQSLWQEIEDKTNQLFYQPWQTLTAPERFELHQLLTELHTVIGNR